MLWQRLQNKQPFDVQRTLFVDDNLDILQSAQTFGIKHLLAVANPDSKKNSRTITQFPAIEDFSDLLSQINANPVS